MATSINRSALILFGSETGNAQDIAEELGRICERLRFRSHVAQLDSIDIRQLLKHQLVLFAISTTGQGDLPANAQRFWKSIRSVRLPPSSLQNLNFASFGLGDSSYVKFNWAHRKLYNRLVQLGARPICPKGESDDQFPQGIDGTFVPWVTELRKAILRLWPLPDGLEPIPDSEPIEPKWRLEVFKSNLPDTPPASHAPPSAQEDVPSASLIPGPGRIAATIVSNERVTASTHFQDTRHVVLSLPGHHDYPPGATLAIHPKNFPSDVSAFLDLMSWTAHADTPLHFVKADPSIPPSDYPPPPISEPTVFTLRYLLENHLDIMSIPRRTFFAQLVRYTTDEFHLDRIREFANPELIDELYDYTTRPRRSILEALSDFPSVKLPWQQICSILPLIRARLFSVASGGLLKDARTFGQDGTRVDLLIAIVKYRTIIKRIRHGLCTRYVSTLEAGDKVNISLSRGALDKKLPKSDIPIVMVGPGTGVAPMRALALERTAPPSQRDSARPIKDVLFFGCRKKGTDEYFADEWNALGINVVTAFSRDAREKVYVQDKIREASALIWQILAERGGYVFVCGSSGRMPQAVRQALTDCFVKEADMGISDAEEYLKKMEKEGRYLQETW